MLSKISTNRFKVSLICALLIAASAATVVAYSPFDEGTSWTLENQLFVVHKDHGGFYSLSTLHDGLIAGFRIIRLGSSRDGMRTDSSIAITLLENLKWQEVTVPAVFVETGDHLSIEFSLFGGKETVSISVTDDHEGGYWYLYRMFFDPSATGAVPPNTNSDAGNAIFIGHIVGTGMQSVRIR